MSACVSGLNGPLDWVAEEKHCLSTLCCSAVKFCCMFRTASTTYVKLTVAVSPARLQDLVLMQDSAFCDVCFLLHWRHCKVTSGQLRVIL